MKHLKTQKITVVTVCILLIFIFGYAYLHKQINELYRKLETIKVELGVMDRLAENRQTTVELLQNLSEKREELHSHFVSTEALTPFLESIESIAEDAGVLLEVKKVNKESSKNNIDVLKYVVDVVFVVDGGWNEFYHFISLLEMLPYTNTITNATYSMNEKDGDSAWSGQVHILCNAI